MAHYMLWRGAAAKNGALMNADFTLIFAINPNLRKSAFISVLFFRETFGRRRAYRE
jgi:hypothetical protein